MSSHQTTVANRLLQSTSVCALMIGAALVVAPQTASAQTWTGAVSDDYADGRNWTGGVAPAGNGSVLINITTNAPVVDTGDTVNGGALAIGPTAAASLTVRGGGRLAASTLGVGGGNDGTGGNGTMLVTGPGSLVTVANQVFVGIRDASTGLLTIEDGATLRAASLLIGGGNGLGNGATGTVTVTGTGSLLEIGNGLFSMGGNTVDPGRGTLNILAGGRAVGGSGTTNFISPLSTINILGTGSSLSASTNLALDGTLLIEEGGALTYSTIVLGGTATLRSGTLAASVIGSSSGLGISAGGALVADGSTIAVGSNFSVSGLATLRGTDLSAAAVNISQNGVLNIGGADGAAAGAAGTLTTQGISVGEPNSLLVFNHSGPDLVVAATISGNGRVLHRSGTTILTAPNSGGSAINGVDLTGGTLLSNGRLRALDVNVSGGGTLGGSGLVEASVAVTDGIIAPGSFGVGRLTLGNLSLTGASVLKFDLGAPGSPGVGSDLIVLGNINTAGRLTLDGTLNVASVGGFGAGLYRLIDYNGPLTDNGLDIGTVPTGFAPADLTVQTSIARQVNLFVGSPLSASFWDGADTTGNGVVDGGTGAWTTQRTSWTLADGSRNGVYDPSQILIFAGTGGTVTVDNGPGAVTVIDRNQFNPLGLQFASDGYRIEGGPIAFDGIATVRVGDGTTEGAAIGATIASNLTGAERIDKTDLGTLTLAGVNTFAGRSRVQGGTLQIAGGGQFTTTGLEIALPGQAATFRVTGAGSVADVRTGIRTGFVNDGPGTVEVLDGGLLRDSAFGGHNFGAGSLVRVSGVGSLLDFGQVSLSQGSLLVENGGVARVAPFAFTSTGSLILRDGGRVETTGGDGNWRIANGVIQGVGTSFFSVRNFSIAPATSSDPGASLVVEDGATVTVDTNADSGLGFDGPLSTLVVRNGASFILTGGASAGLQTENARLTVDNATFSIGGQLLAGQRFGNTTIALRNADFTAASIALRAATDRIFIGADVGEVAAGAGRFDVGSISLTNAATTLVLNHNSTGFEIDSEFNGLGALRHIAGDTRFTSAVPSFWGGSTLLEGGSLAIDGLFGSIGHRMSVTGGSILSGRGTIGGAVSVADGTIRPGGDPLSGGGSPTAQALSGGDPIGNLTFSGALTLGTASRLAFQLGAPTGEAGVDSDLITVGGNLVLDGTLDVADAGGFGAGLYRLINYGGTLTDNGLLIGAVPGGFSATDLTIQTAIAQQVNLLVGAPPPIFSSFSFWDGGNTTANDAIDGGVGVWTTTGQNWTVSTGEANGVYDPTQLLIFSGAAGVVTVDTAPGTVSVNQGLQFATNGYTVEGGDLTLGTNAVVLRVGDGTAAGAGIGATIASNLIGGASIEKTDLGTLILTGNAAPTDGTRITNGTLQIGAGGDTGSIGGDIVNNGALVFNRAGTLDYQGMVSGGGTLEQRGPGTLTLSGMHSYTGLTTVTGGTLSNTGTILGATNVLAAGTLTNAGMMGTVVNAGTGANTGTMGGLTNTAGSFTNTGTLNGSVINSSGATFVTTGTLNGGLTNSGTARIGGIVNGALDNRVGTVTLTDATTGIGALTQTAGASLNLAAFALTAGSLAGDGAILLGSGILTTGGDDASTGFAGIVSGAGRLVKDGTGELTLTGTNSYTGGTTVLGGTLRGSTVSLTGPMVIDAAGTVQFDQSADGTFGDVFTGSGLLRKTGTGTLSITGVSTDFAGTTRAEAGTLAVSGTLGGNVVIEAPATLIGTARLGALDVFGVVSPGGMIGTLDVTGDVVFRAGSTYAVDLAAAGGSDRILADGRATLEGGTVAITTLDPEIDYRNGSIFRILNATGGLTGTFAGLSETSAFLDFTLGYDATGALITISQIRTFPDVAQTFNQHQAAGALKALDRTPGSDALAVYNQILMLDEGMARGAFDASSGEIYASVIDARQRAAITLAGQFAIRGKAGLAEGLGVWGGLTSYDSRVAGDGNGGRIDADALGGELGVDYRGEANGWAVGMGGGWQNGDVEVASRASDAEIDSWHLGAYARYGTGAAGFTALATGVYAQADADITRGIGFGTLSRTARADADVQTTALSLDLRYGFGGGKVTFGPTSSIRYASNTLDAFNERGAGALALSAGKNNDDWTRFGLGGFVRATHDAGYIDLSARMVTGDRSNASADLMIAGSTQDFTVRAARGAATAAEIQVSTAYDLGGNWSLAGQAGFIGGDGDNEVSGNVRIGFRF